MTLVDRWASGDAYEPFIGRWSRLVAAEFVKWLNPRRGRTWLDVGCGTGALSQTILTDAEPSTVRGIDPSADFVATARRRVKDSQVEFTVGDAGSIEAPDSSYDYVVSGLVINFIPDVASAIVEMGRVARSGGRVASYVWDYSDGMQMLRYFWDAATELDPRAADLDEGLRFDVCRPEPLADIWKESGLVEVNVVPIEVPTIFSDFDDYWNPFLGGQGPAPTYAMSLDEETRGKLRDLVRERLPIDDRGRIALAARAWAVAGTRE